MALDLTELKKWARISSTVDDTALTLAYASTVLELEVRTGWCYESVSRTQFVANEPPDDYVRPPYVSYYVPPNVRYIRLERQPATAVSGVDANGSAITITLVEINGLKYAKIATGLSYPLTLSVTAGTGTLDPMLKVALYSRITQLAQSRGDDTVPVNSDFWDNICAMVGKAVG
jgi:hypothetical protein